jgi:hypothetical protein
MIGLGGLLLFVIDGSLGVPSGLGRSCFVVWLWELKGVSILPEEIELGLVAVAVLTLERSSWGFQMHGILMRLWGDRIRVRVSSTTAVVYPLAQRFSVLMIHDASAFVAARLLPRRTSATSASRYSSCITKLMLGRSSFVAPNKCWNVFVRCWLGANMKHPSRCKKG